VYVRFELRVGQWMIRMWGQTGAGVFSSKYEVIGKRCPSSRKSKLQVAIKLRVAALLSA
jgi:hypothetical protein